MKTIFGIFKISWRICLAAFGLALVGSELNDIFVLKTQDDWVVAAMIFAIGILMMWPLYKYVKQIIDEWREELSDASYTALFKTKTAEYAEKLKNGVLGAGYVVKEDFNEQERLISQFREDYNRFFHEQGEGIRENTSLQNTATQVYWNTLALQKKRLDKKGITMSMEAQRMCYGKDAAPVSGDVIFDGKYEISYISEMINATRRFFKNGRKIALFKSKEVARYRMLDTKKNDKGMIVCPNCGAMSTRENLIDGCDYCGTKFTVEDLGMRVSDFGLYPDASVEYKKYKDRRSKYGARVGLLTAIPCIIFMIYDTIDSITNHFTSEDGILFDIGIMIIVTVMITLLFVSLAEVLFFTTLFPILQAKASFTYLEKKALEALKNSEKNNQEAEQNIRKYDKWFSFGGFCSNVQNKLAILHYADNSKQAEFWGEGSRILEQLGTLLRRYENVVNMDVSSMVLDNYTVGEELQKVDVTANLVLLEVRGDSIEKRNEKVQIRLIKDKNCLTQAVSGPEILTCKMCGSSISLLDGSTCGHCGNVLHLSKYDWAIEDYKIL